ncbi:hypothetical protein BH09MYX1_BH09MYX1_13830 [soil metagenome]
MYSVRLMKKLESRSLVAAALLVGLATMACKGKLGAGADGGTTTTTTTAAGGGGDVCQVPKSEMCLEFDTHSILTNQKSCNDFESGSFQASGVCAKELRIGSCRVSKDGMNAIYFGGENNDIHDSQEHCEETLHGVFTGPPAKDVNATWIQNDLTGKLAGFTMTMPAQSKQDAVGSGLSLERFTGYYGVILTKGKMSVSEQKTDAREGSEYFKFDSFVTDTATKLVWKVRAAKGGDIGYKFALQVSASGTDFTCESLTVFDNMELADANIESCGSVAKK